MEFSETEKDRITESLLNTESRPYRVLTTKAQSIHDFTFWHRAQKHFHVTGFRDGHPTAITMVMNRALAGLKEATTRGPHAAWPLIWPLYMRTVQLYLSDDLPALHSLLMREDFRPSPGTLTEQILTCVVRTLPLHDATVQQVRELYDLWGFDRTTNIDEILTGTTIDAETVRRLVADGVSGARREIAAALSSTRSDLIQHIDEHDSQLGKLRTEIDRARTDFSEAIVRVQETIDQHRAPPTVEDCRRESQPNQISTDSQARGRDSEQRINALQSRIDGLGRQLKELRIRLDQVAVTPTDHHIPGRTGDGAALITTRRFLSSWLRHLPSGATLNGAWLLLEIVRRSRIILTDIPDLFATLFKCAPGAEIRSVATSPLWLEDSDWKDPLTYITQPSAVPRLLQILDFDVAVQDTYLIPPLVNWLATVPPSCANRILLVPSRSEMGASSPRAFEIASVISRDSTCIREIQRLGNNIVDGPQTLDIEQTSTRLLEYVQTTNASYETHLHQFAANYGVILPPRALGRFVSLYEGLRAALGSRDAGQIAEEACINSWIETARGEAVARTLQQALSQALNGD